jgi:ABC-type antimicrobial peptide transport system permease subunit
MQSAPPPFHSNLRNRRNLWIQTTFWARALVALAQQWTRLVIGAQAQTRFSLLLIGVFSAIAPLLAGVGLYGVLATSVRQRTAEIGVWMALGAAPSSIFRLMVGKGLYLSVLGIAIGLLAALALTRVLTSMLVEVKPTDPATFFLVTVLFLVIAVMASWLPALRAAGLDPTTALRNE